MTIKTIKEINEFKKRVRFKLKEHEEAKKNNSAYVVPKVSEDAQCKIDIKDLLDELYSTIITYNQEYGLKWMKGLQSYISDKKGDISYANYSRGNVVLVELFGHYSSELTFEHFAVVLYDNQNIMLVAPITTSKYNDLEEMHIDLDESNGLYHPCAALVDEIRVINKSRVVRPLEKDNSIINIGSEKLDQIDEIILKNFLPKVFEERIQLNKQLEKEKEKYQNLEEKQSELVNEYQMLKQLYDKACLEIANYKNQEAEKIHS